MSLIPDHGPTTRDQGVVSTFTFPSPSPQTCINTSWASPSAPHHLERQVHRAPRRLELSYTGLPFAQVGLVIATPLTAPQWELNPYSCPRFSSGCTCKKPSSSPLHELTWLVPPLPFPHLCSYGDLRLRPLSLPVLPPYKLWLFLISPCRTRTVSWSSLWSHLAHSRTQYLQN